MADVFISYAEADRDTAGLLAKKVAALGYTVWWDPNLVGGSRYREAILEQLRLARAVLVIWSPNSIQSHFVEDEAEEARAEGKFIPLRARDVTLKQIPLGFRSYQTRLVDDIAGIAEAIEALGLITHASPEFCNMFSFRAEEGQLTEGIKSVRERPGRPPRIAVGDDMVWSDLDNPPVFDGKGDFFSGDTRRVRDGRYQICGPGNAFVAIVLVHSGRLGNQNPATMENHGSTTWHVGGNELIAGTPFGPEIVERRTSLWRMHDGSMLFVKGCTPKSLFRLIAATGHLLVVPAAEYEKHFDRLVKAQPSQSRAP